jgi:tetratricopeptide (TPR) repeat protein
MHSARLLWFCGRADLFGPRNELALQLAETLRLPEVLAHGLNNRGNLLLTQQRLAEATALLTKALEISQENNLSVVADRSAGNLIAALMQQDRLVEALDHAVRAAESARRVGNRSGELWQRATAVAVLVGLGRWEEALRDYAQVRDAADLSRASIVIELITVAVAMAHRGDIRGAREVLDLLPEGAVAEDVQTRGVYRAAEAVVLRAEGRLEDGLAAALEAWGVHTEMGLNPYSKDGLAQAIDLSLELGHLDRAESLLGEIEAFRPGELFPFVRGMGARLGARLAAARGDHARPDEAFRAAVGIFREIPMDFWVAVTLLEHGEWLAGRGGADEAVPLFEEAGTIFERLGARPWLERLARVRGELVAADPEPAGTLP